MKKNLLIYGMQRTGTNFLQTLIDKNFNVKVHNGKHRHLPAHKHFRLYDEKSLVPEQKFRNDLFINSFDEYIQALNIKKTIHGVLLISKDPYSWLKSYRNWGARQTDWFPTEHHYIEEYSLFYKRWFEFKEKDQRIYHLRYIDLLTNTKHEVEQLADYFDLKNKVLRNLLGSINSFSKVPQSDKFTQERFKFYQNKEYLKLYSNEEIQLVNGLLNDELLEKMGYQKERRI